MLNVKMSVQDFNNLKIFLERVQLSGKEAIAYISIMQSLSNAQPNENKEISAVEKEVK